MILMMILQPLSQVELQLKQTLQLKIPLRLIQDQQIKDLLQEVLNLPQLAPNQPIHLGQLQHPKTIMVLHLDFWELV